MKVRLLSVFIMFSFALNAQTWLSEDFSESTFPPEGWTIDENADNWKQSQSNYAGGTTGEASLRTLPIVDGSTRLISPVMNITNSSNVAVSFIHTLKLYQSGTVIDLQIRLNGGEWINLWERNSSVSKEEIDVVLSDMDDLSNCQIAFLFTGNTGTIKFWDIDDILIYTKKTHDIAVKEKRINSYAQPSHDISPKTRVYNNGLNAESFDVYCHIYKNDELLFTNMQPVSDLAAGIEQEIAFDSYELPETPDEAYHIVYSSVLAGDELNTNDSIEQYVYTYVTYERDMVVVEIGTATWCSACPYAAEAADSIVKNGYNLAVIEHHTDDDYSSEATDNRDMDYYAMIGYPTAFFDGVDKQLGAGPYFYSNYYNHYYQRSIKKVGLGISIDKFTKDNDYQASVSIAKLAPAFNKEVVVHLIVTESHIAEHWQDEDELNYVTRLMLPDENGIPINIADNDEIRLDYLIETEDSWNIDELEVVAFIQDNATHEILNATKLKYSELSAVDQLLENSIARLIVYPNPIATTAMINFTLDKSAVVNIEVLNMMGQSMANISHRRFEKGNHELNWSIGDKLPNGIYFIKLMADERIETTKIIIRK